MLKKVRERKALLDELMNSHHKVSSTIKLTKPQTLSSVSLRMILNLINGTKSVRLRPYNTFEILLIMIDYRTT